MNATSIKPVIVYDGECGFCLRQIDRIRRRDDEGRFEFVSRQTEGLDARYPALAEGDFNTGMRLIEPDGTILVGADVVHRLMRSLGPLKFLAWLYHVPGLKQLARAMYGWIAANRHRLGGSCATGPCPVPGAPDSDSKPS